MQLFPKIPSGMANSVDPDQTALSLLAYVIFGVQNFRTFTVIVNEVTLCTNHRNGWLHIIF